MDDELARLNAAEALAELGSWSMELPEGRLVWSPGMFRILGLDPATPPTIEGYQALVHPDDLDAVAKANQAAMEGGGGSGTHRIIRPDGQTRWVHARSKAVMEGGHPIRLHGTLQDVTKARNAQMRFEALLEAAPDAMVITDAEGTITYTNHQVEAMLGYAPDELVGQKVEMLVPKAFRGRHPGHRASFHERPNTRPMGAGVDLAAAHKDGHEIPVEISLSPLESDDGRYVIAAVRDISDRKRQERNFEALLESAPDAMVIVDEQGQIVLANRQTETLFGYERSELVGQPVEILVPERFAGGHPDKRQAYTDQPVIRPMGAGLELFGRHKAGHDIPVEISLSPLQTEAGRLVIAAVRDITQRKDMESAAEAAREQQQQIERLEEVTRFKTQLLNTASHELNTPITPLRMQLHMLATESLGALNEKQKRSVAMLKRNVDRLSNLVADVLDVARMESGKLKIEPVRMELDPILAEVFEMFDVQAQERGVDLQLGPATGIQVDADRDRLLQVVINFTSNAMKFTPEAGVVRIDAATRDRAVRVEVTDTGRGLSGDERERLFQAFSQVHSPQESTEAGTGLGLYIAKGIIEQHGGRIGVDSKGLGHGSTFWFELPTS